MTDMTPAEQFEILPEWQKLSLLEEIFTTLNAFPEWDAETLQIVGGKFAEFGVEFSQVGTGH